MSVITLPSSRGRSARQNLEVFVARARDGVAAFGSDLDFDAPSWDVTESHVTRGSSGHRKARLFFTAHVVGTGKGMEGREPFSEPFGSFVKAMVRLREEGGHVSSNIHAVTIRASRYLYDAAAGCGHDPCGLLPDHFLTAAAACKTREELSSAYRIGIALAAIADWLNRYNLSRVKIDFRNPFDRVAHDTRIGREAEGRRKSKLPSDTALSALAKIANIVEDPADKLRVRCVELLVCGGWRINELLTIRADCEIFDPATEDGRPLLDQSGEQVIRYGISYFAEKGAGPRTKWIPSPMVDVAKRAVADIRRITQPARDTLVWMAANRGRAKLPDPWHDGSGTLYTARDVGEMFGLSKTMGVARAFLATLGIPLPGNNAPVKVARSDLEAALLARHTPVGLASVPLRPEQYLFVMPRNWGHRGRAVISSIVDPVSDQQISDLVSGREGVDTIFARYGFNNEDGSPIRVTTHQFRHWLNTLAQQGGMSQMEIARWSGRKDIGQNAAYDHRSGVEMAAEARKMMAAGKVQGPVAELHRRLPPVKREAFRDMLYTTAHTTDLGMCANDFSLVPCTEHGACAACTQHLVVKGNAAQRSRAETLLEENKTLLERAEAEAEEETYGASNHVAHLRRTCDALARILAVHGDADVPDGNLVQLELATGVRGLGLDVGRAA